MPQHYADNLYSADDSDGESFSEQLSPTDGYFINRAVPDAIVPDPSLPNAFSSAEAKAQEAEADAMTVHSGYARSHRDISSIITVSSDRVGPFPPSASDAGSSAAVSSTTPAHIHSQRLDAYSESSSLLPPGAPPPAYYPSPSSTGPQPPFPSRLDYRTIPHTELEGLISHREPESMGGPDDFNESTPLWRNDASKLFMWRNIIEHILSTALVLSLVVTAVVLAVQVSETSLSKSPEKHPSFPTPEDGSSRTHGAFCTSATINVAESMPTYEFTAGERLSILQVDTDDAVPSEGSIVVTNGQINLRALPHDSSNPEVGLITFDTWYSYSGIRMTVEMDPDAQALRITTPSRASSTAFGKVCISLEINVWLPEGVSLENVYLFTSHLSIKVFDDVNMRITRRGDFETVKGSVAFPILSQTELARLGYLREPDTISNSIGLDDGHVGLDDQDYPGSSVYRGIRAREIYIESTSGAISGLYHLFDILSISSRSGSVNVEVFPEPILKTDPKPAQLTIETTSGNIYARHPVYHSVSIPVRDYRSRIVSASGSLKGTFILGTQAIFKTYSGSLDIVALPDTITEISTFYTDCTSGNARIDVLSPLVEGRGLNERSSRPVVDVGDGDPYLLIPYDPEHGEEQKIDVAIFKAMRRLRSQHTTKSGSQRIRYPSAWEGEIDAQTISGDIKIGGDDVRIIRDGRKNWAHREVVARKGVDFGRASNIMADGISGSVQIWIGDE